MSGLNYDMSYPIHAEVFHEGKEPYLKLSFGVIDETNQCVALTIPKISLRVRNFERVRGFLCDNLFVHFQAVPDSEGHVIKERYYSNLNEETQ